MDHEDFEESGYPTPIITLDTIFTDNSTKGFRILSYKRITKIMGIIQF